MTRLGGNINNFVSTTAEILNRFIEQYFPTQIQQPVGILEVYVCIVYLYTALRLLYVDLRSF